MEKFDYYSGYVKFHVRGREMQASWTSKGIVIRDMLTGHFFEEKSFMRTMIEEYALMLLIDVEQGNFMDSKFDNTVSRRQEINH